ncbi:hypothetical protein EAI_13604 [Harpegnathos saltator]|uniref:Uncharacterized protein n=1 Tax=Harpegnathos saltator TaxID=610380 RepID=E2BDS6_HARSA|nr:hypothetical protein EAI_13604 [Harpegnathos saltator]
MDGGRNSGVSSGCLKARIRAARSRTLGGSARTQDAAGDISPADPCSQSAVESTGPSSVVPSAVTSRPGHGEYYQFVPLDFGCSAFDLCRRTLFVESRTKIIGWLYELYATLLEMAL